MGCQSTYEQEFFQELLNVTERLKSHVSIYVADQETPYTIERRLLQIHSEHFRAHEASVFHFPDDNLNAWRALLYWLMEQKLPSFLDGLVLNENYEFVIECYALGEKYGFEGFQDAIMRLLFLQIDDWDINTWWGERHTVAEVINLIFRSAQTMPKLREVFVEQAVLFKLWEDDELFGALFSQQQLIERDGTGFFQLYAQKQAEMSPNWQPEKHLNGCDEEDDMYEEEKWDIFFTVMGRSRADDKPLRPQAYYMVVSRWECAEQSRTSMDVQ